MANIRNLLRRSARASVVEPNPTPQVQAQPVNLDDVLNALTARNGDTGYVYKPMPRDPRWGNQFGPNFPFTPSPLDQPRPDGGVDPRYSEYDITWNLQMLPQPRIPFARLRQAADDIDIMRRCIQMRKKDIAAREWGFTVSTKAVNREAERTGKPRQDVQAKLNKQYADQINKANAFWAAPGRNQGYDWEAWTWAALEEYLVIDAWCVFPQKTYGGDLYSLDLIMGETIKPLRDNRGGIPHAPFAAYQQVLWGFPRGEYIASTVMGPDGKPVVDSGFGRNELYYIVRDTKVRSPFGRSPVEQALTSSRLYLKRQGWMLSEYDEGVLPRAWIETDANAATGLEMDVYQRREWQDSINDELGGDTAARQKATVLPPGMKATESSSADERYKPDYDLFLIKLNAMHFDVPITKLGFTEAKGLGNSGYHEGQADDYERQAMIPDTRWFSNWVSRISHEQLGISPDVVHQFLGLDQEDEAAQDAIWENRVRSGRATRNEDRNRLNLPLFTFREADMPMLETTRGIVPIEGSADLVYPGQMLEPMEFAPTAPGQTAMQQNQQPGAGGQGPGQKAPAKPAASKPSGQGKQGVTVNIHNHGGSTQAQKSAELAAFRKFAAKRGPASREFWFEHMAFSEAPVHVQVHPLARFHRMEADDE